MRSATPPSRHTKRRRKAGLRAGPTSRPRPPPRSMRPPSEGQIVLNGTSLEPYHRIMKRHWPMILGILLVIGAVAAYRCRGAAASTPGPRPGTGTPAGETSPEASTPGQEVPPKPSPETPDPKKPAKIPMGSLRVVLQGAGFLNGQVIVLGPDDYPENSLEVSGSDRVEVLAQKLKPGPKRVVYVSQRSFLPVSAGATVEADRVGEVLL